MKTAIITRCAASILILFVVSILGCGGNSSSTPPTPPVPEHMYVAGNTAGPSNLYEFTLPFTSSSAANVALSSGIFSKLAEDANGNLAFSGGFNQGSGVFLLNAPLTNSSTPFASVLFSPPFSIDTPPAFNAAGDLFVSDSFQVFFVPHPLTSTSQPTQTITDPNFTSIMGLAVDANNNLIVDNGGFFPKLLVFAPPYNSAPTIVTLTSTFGGTLAIHNSQLFVAEELSGPRIDVFNLPITASSQPIFSIASGQPRQLAFDSAGNLYVVDGGILVYQPPFSASSTPVLKVFENTLPGVDPRFAVTGIAVGK